MSVQERVHDLLEGVVATLDVELVDVEFNGGTLRVTVDQPEGITTEALTAVNRLISPVLDQHDPVPGRYTLEVSSPGLERPLRRAAHYRRAVGEQILVKLVSSVTPRRLKGRLLEAPAEPEDGAELADDAEVTIDVDEIDGVPLDESEQRTVTIGEVATARTVFDWGPGPKPGQPGAKAARQKSAKNKQKKSPLNREVRDEQ